MPITTDIDDSELDELIGDDWRDAEGCEPDELTNLDTATYGAGIDTLANVTGGDSTIEETIAEAHAELIRCVSALSDGRALDAEELSSISECVATAAGQLGACSYLSR